MSHPARTRLLAVWALLLAALSFVALPATAAAATAATAATVNTAPKGLPAANDAYDRMASYTADIVADPDGGATFTETIDYRFGTSGGRKHGIIRNIVTRQTVEGSDDSSYRYYALDLQSVTSPTGASTKTSLTDGANGPTQIKVGDAKTYVDGFAQTYVLTYHLANIVNPIPATGATGATGGSGGSAGSAGSAATAELFYNVFKGDPIPKDQVTITVKGPASITQVKCVRGNTDPGEPCDTATAGATATFAVSNLLGNENLTIDSQFPRTAFSALAPDIRTSGSAVSAGQAKVLTSLALAGGVGVPLVAAGVMGVLVSSRGRDEWYAGLTPGLSPGLRGATGPDPSGSPPAVPPVVKGRRPEIAVQFNPPPGVQPGMVGTVIDESADTVDVSATVMDLAVRGFLRIEETQSGAVFSRTDWNLTRLPTPPGEALRRYESTVLEGIFETGDQVALSELKYKFATTLHRAIGQMYDEVVQRGWFRKSPQRARAGWQALGLLLIVAGVVTGFFLGAATYGIDRTGGFGIGIPSGLVLGIGLVVAGLIFRILGKRMAARTAEGSAVYAQSLGFRQYLVTAEASQIRFEEASAIFSRYLPYAIVFGVADRWAGTFQKVAEAAQAAGQPLLMPAWYIYNGAMFPNFTGIADGAGSFASSAGGTFAATASSGSSGGSGFSGGGGFAGGGIGGSSSGSW